MSGPSRRRLPRVGNHCLGTWPMRHLTERCLPRTHLNTRDRATSVGVGASFRHLLGSATIGAPHHGLAIEGQPVAVLDPPRLRSRGAWDVESSDQLGRGSQRAAHRRGRGSRPQTHFVLDDRGTGACRRRRASISRRRGPSGHQTPVPISSTFPWHRRLSRPRGPSSIWGCDQRDRWS